MSFLTDIKKQILNQPYKSACCRRAMLNGIIFAKGSLINGEVCITLEHKDSMEYTSVLVKEFFGKEVDISTSNIGGRRKILSFTSGACEKYLHLLSTNATPLFNERCTGCVSAFLRGVFIACGRITDPEKRYRLEFSPVDRQDILLEYFSQSGINLSLSERRGERILYTGNSSVAEDFFALIGMNSIAFLLMNSKIESDFKNTANRIRNCETNNILKTVSAAAKWIEAIEALEKANLLSTLPEELEKTARLRIEHRDYSLSRLAAEFTPPISKPGLSHRLNKILEISENLLGKRETT